MTTKKSGFAIVSLVLGLCSILFFWTFVVPILATIFGIFSLNKIKKTKNLEGKSMAILGLCLGGFFILLALIFFISGTIERSKSNAEFDKLMEELDKKMAPLYEYEDQKNRIQEALEEDHYEVLYVGIFNYTNGSTIMGIPIGELNLNATCVQKDFGCYYDFAGAFVTVKSLGSRNEQIWDMLITIYTRFPDAFVYGMTIKSPTDTCKYTILGWHARDYFGSYSLDARSEIEEDISLFEDCE